MTWMSAACASLGRQWFALLVYLARITELLTESLRVSCGLAKGRKCRVRWGMVVEHVVIGGFNSIPIVFMIIFLVGSILSLQSIYQMGKLGVERFVPDLIGVSFLRELAPLITAVMISARVGAAITAELGSMKVSEQVLALETLAISPVEFLVVPRVLSLLIVVPCLTLFSDLIGIFGGAVAGLAHLDTSVAGFFDAALKACVNKDLATGLVKSIAFGGVIGLVSCHEGLSVEGGARGVGVATTRSVVNSIILIVTVDLLFTAAFFQ